MNSKESAGILTYLVLANLLFVVFPVTGFGAISLKPPKSVAANATSAIVTVTFSNEQATSATLEVSVDAPAGMVASVTGDGTLVSLKRGKGTAKITVSLTQNQLGNPRTAVVTVNGVSANIIQAGVPCTLTLGSAAEGFEYVGGDGAIAVTSPAGCSWQATAPSWLSLSSVKGEGSGTVGYSVPPNTGKNRTGKITISTTDPVTGKQKAKKMFTVSQKDRKFVPAVTIGTPAPITSATDAGKSYLIGRRAFDQISQFTSGLADLPILASPSRTGKLRLPANVEKKLLLPLRKSLSGSREPVQEDCDSGQITGDVSTGKGTLQFESCRSGNDLLDGTISLRASASRTGAVGSFTIGSSADPFIVTSYADDGTTILSTVSTVLTGKFALADFSDVSVTVNGTADVQEQGNSRVLVDLKNFALDASTNNSGYMALNTSGAVRMSRFDGNDFVSALELRTENFGVSVSQDNFYDTETVTMDGLLAVESFPPDSCLDGTFLIQTRTPLVIPLGGVATSGVIEINRAVITVAGDGGITVTINGSDTQLSADDIAGLCPL